MLDSIRSRILAACIIIVAGSLAINTYFNYSVANKYNSSAIDNTLTAVTASHGVGIADWVATKTQMIVSLKESALTADPSAALRQVAAAGASLTFILVTPIRQPLFLIPMVSPQVTTQPGVHGIYRRLKQVNPWSHRRM